MYRWMTSIIWNEKKSKRFIWKVTRKRLKKGFWHFLLLLSFPSSFFIIMSLALYNSCQHRSSKWKKRNEGNHQIFFLFSMKSYHARNKLDENLQPRKIFKKKFSSVSMWQKILSFHSIFSFLIWKNKKRKIFKEHFFRVIRKQQKEIRYWRNWEH